jgi:hypothetical protein
MKLGNKGASFNSKTADEGIWVDTPFGFAVQLRSILSKAHRAQVIQRRHLIMGLNKDPVAYEEVSRRITAESVIVGWRGVIDVDGNPIEFSTEMLRRVLDNEDNRPFVDWVIVQASQPDGYQDDLIKN